jgi:aspartate/methionine/tyrosine aminotransferase
MTPRLSRRLPWDAGESPFAAALRRAREAGERLLDLTVTNPTEVGLGTSIDVRTALGLPGALDHEPRPFGREAARRAVAQEYARAGRAVEAHDVVLTASSSESYSFLFKLLADPGDAVLVPEPSYPLFDHLARLEGLEPRPYPLLFDGEWHLDVEAIELRGARAAVVVNPNNPTGSLLQRSEWARLSARAAQEGVALICDEVFTDYVLAPRPGSIASVLDVEAAAPTFVLGGLSKSCALPQWKVGWIVAAGPEAARRRALSALELVADTYLSVGGPAQHLLPHLLSGGTGIRALIRQRLLHNVAFLSDFLRGSPCTPLAVEAGWSALVRLPIARSDEEWALELLSGGALVVQPGYLFDLPFEASVVLSLLTPPAVFEEGVRRLAARASS